MDRIALILHVVGWGLLMSAAPSCLSETSHRALYKARQTVVGSCLDADMDSYLELSFKKLEQSLKEEVER